MRYSIVGRGKACVKDLSENKKENTVIVAGEFEEEITQGFTENRKCILRN